MLTSFSFALKSLKSHKLRTVLAVLAVSIGIAAVIIVMSAGEGLRSLIMGQVELFGSDLIQIEIKVPSTRKNSQQNAMGIASGITITTLKDEDRQAILSEIPGAISAYAGVIDQEQVVREENRKKAMIFGTSYSAAEVDNGMKIESGRMYTQTEERGMARVAVIGADVKEKLFGQSSPIGENIKIKQKQFKIIGILKKRGGSSFFNFDDLIYIPLHTLQSQIIGIDHISFISVKANQNMPQKTIASQIERLLRKRHDIYDPDKDDFAVTTMEEAREMVDSVLGAVQILLLALAAISLAVGGVGIMNIMYVSVKERTFEIGLRKALGAKYVDILLQILWESFLIALLGAFVGIISGVAIAFSASRLALSKGFSWKFIIPPISIFLAAGFSSAVGILFGYWPARSAARKNAIEALTESQN